MTFVCNLCSSTNEAELAELTRESGRCATCGSFVRARYVLYLLGQALFGADEPVSRWPQRRDLRVVGVSDWPALSPFLMEKISYVNTQFDEDLRGTGEFLDITAPSDAFLGSANVVTCSDVLEHVPFPVQRAFEGLFSVLAPGGALILTVPYIFGPTIEHFPEMHHWALAERGGERILFNATKDGRLQEFSNLCFHGGGEAVLEMRVFGLDDLIEHLKRAGFIDIKVENQEILAFGIRSVPPQSLPITAIKPA